MQDVRVQNSFVMVRAGSVSQQRLEELTFGAHPCRGRAHAARSTLAACHGPDQDRRGADRAIRTSLIPKPSAACAPARPRPKECLPRPPSASGRATPTGAGRKPSWRPCTPRLPPKPSASRRPWARRSRRPARARRNSHASFRWSAPMPAPRRRCKPSSPISTRMPVGSDRCWRRCSPASSRPRRSRTGRRRSPAHALSLPPLRRFCRRPRGRSSPARSACSPGSRSADCSRSCAAAGRAGGS